MSEPQVQARAQLDDAIATGARVWLGFSLADGDMRDCVLHALELGVSHAAVNATTWLLASADALPRALTVRLLCQLLSEHETLLGPPN